MGNKNSECVETEAPLQSRIKHEINTLKSRLHSITSIVNNTSSLVHILNDTDIFNTNNDYCFGKKSVVAEIDIDKCSHLQRMLRALSHYQLLKLDLNKSRINKSSADIFIKFF